jgi:hypothetical protein
MVQFVGIMVHGFQLLFIESCGFPWQYGLYIAAHAVMFFILFSQFYVKEYFTKGKKAAKEEMIKTKVREALATFAKVCAWRSYRAREFCRFVRFQSSHFRY